MVLDLEKLASYVEVLERMNIEEVERIKKAADMIVYAENKMLTAQEVASIMNTSAAAVRNWYSKGILQGSKICGELRFTQDDVRAFQEEVKGCTVTKSGDVHRRFQAQ